MAMMTAQVSQGDHEKRGDVTVHDAIRAFVETTSFEMAAGDLKGLESAKRWLPVGTTISITWLPSADHEARIATARALTDAGLVPVPHIAARRISTSLELDRILARLADEAGVNRAFLIAGDLEDARGPFGSSRQLLESGFFQRRGFRRIGIAGYPEGHPQIETGLLQTELNTKLIAIRDAGMESEVVTQFCFEAAPIRQWLGTLRRDFSNVPVRIGLAGAATIRTLIRFAKICGLGSSARAIFSHGASIARLLNEAGPDPIIRDLMSDPDLHGSQTMLHLFPFGGLERTSHWAATVRSGNFSLSGSEIGFRVG
jgi:methylenetetrahydrofolate reductase (NADPH)